MRQLIDDGVLGELIYGEADYGHPARRATPGSPGLRKDVVGSAFLSGGRGCGLGGEVRQYSTLASDN